MIEIYEDNLTNKRKTGIYAWKEVGFAILDVKPVYVLDLEKLNLSQEILDKILEEAKKDDWDIIYYKSGENNGAP